jgi:Sap, sulfolipid-1-addressing protein
VISTHGIIIRSDCQSRRALSDLVPLAIASAFWPILLAVVLISLRAPHPVRLMASFLVAGLLTTVAVGLVVIYVLKDASLTSGSDSWFGPGAEIVAGVAALAAAWILRRRQLPAGAEPAPKKPGPSRMERMLDHGAPLAFVAGIVLNLAPGIVPLVALKDIAELDYSFAATLATLICFYVIMFAFVEIPLVGYMLAPKRTARETARFNDWLDRNGSNLGIGALALIGVYLIGRGILRIV